MSAVAEISKPSTTVMFTAVRDGLRLVKRARYPIFGPGGRAVGEEPGQAVVFRDGMLRVPPEGIMLEDGRRMDADEALEWLRAHRLFGNVEDGFTEIAQAAPPVSQDELSAMMAAAYDDVALERIIAAEKSGWQRDSLLVPAREALARLREYAAQVAAQQQVAEVETVKPAAKKRPAAR